MSGQLLKLKVEHLLNKMRILTSLCSNLFNIVLTLLLSLAFFPPLAHSEETYVFERMWPTLQQPWYFTYPEGIGTDNAGNVYVADTVNHRIQKFTSDGQFLTSWGNAGSGDGKFNQPLDVEIDHSGNVYVVDRNNNRIQKFTSHGQLITQWGTQGSGDGQFDFRFNVKIAIDNSGNIYVTDNNNNRIQKFDSDGHFLSKWGVEGSGDGEFYHPCSIAIDKHDNIYVADGYNRIQKFDVNGQFLLKWGGTGSGNNWAGNGDGEFNRPYDIAIDNNGFLFVVEQDNHRIQKFTPEGVFVDKWGFEGRENGQFWHPKGIALDANGNLYVADTFNNRIQKFTSQGHFVSKWNSGGVSEENFDRPRGITVDNSGNIYVSEAFGNRIQKFTSGGQFIRQWGSEGSGEGELKWPYGMATDNSGFVYVAEASNDRIQKFTQDGQFVKQWGGDGSGDGQLNTPMDVAVNSQGIVYVAEFFGDRIQKFTSDGQFIGKWGSSGSGDGQFTRPAGISIDSDGFVYVVDASNNRIQKFTADGQFIGKWGSYGTGDGQFNDPRSIVVDNDNYVYVGDTGNDRVQKFTSDGQFVAKWGGSGNYPGQMRSPWVAVGPNGKVFVAESSNNRIQVFNKVTLDSNNKAIIVAGGGPYPGNNLWDATEMSANFAYRALAFQGFTKESIFYISSDTDLDLDSNGETDDVDGDATNNNLETAISDWATNADNVLLYLVNHGGDGTFRMSGSETLTATDLDAWLDQLQQTITGRVVVVYDACESGSFLDALTPPPGKERIVITSTSPGENAQFVTQGSVSFSNYFWTHIFNGEDIKNAFLLSENAIANSTDSLQNSLLDADGDGNANEAEDSMLVEGLYIGNGTIIQGDAPVIGSANAPQTINDGSSAVLSSIDVTDDDGIARVWAVIRPPDYSQGSSGNPVQDLPSIDLLPVGNDRYDNTYSDFNIEGTYHIAVYARDRAGNTSTPKLTTVSVNNPLRRKAIIVAGGSQTDDLWDTIEKSVKLAYEAISFQGYADEDIYLLSPTSIPGVNKLPLQNIPSNLDYAVNTWAQENGQDLVIYLVGKGGLGTFRLNNTEIFPASDLGAWLDDLQDVIPGKVTVIYDADHSGSFLPLLAAGGDTERILISGSTAGQSANFLSTGDISFSKFFWRRVLNGMNIRDAFVHAKNAMRWCSGQVAQLDDNGNGTGNEKRDGLLAREYSIGVGILLAGDDPLIGAVSPDQTLAGTSGTAVWADNIATTNSIDRVWAVVSAPTHLTASPPLPNIVELLDNDGDGRYEGNVTNLILHGTYTVAIYAMDTYGNVSLPSMTDIQQTIGPDLFEDDDSSSSAGVLILNATETRTHTFHDAGDKDWVKFYAIAGQSYEIETNSLGTNCDTAITLYDSTGTNALLTVDDGWHGDREFTSWACEASGLYYIKVTQADPGDHGENTSYDLVVYRPVAPVSAWFVGTIVNAVSGAPIGNAILQTTGLGSAISLPESGSYGMIHDLGTEPETLTVVADGYMMFSNTITVVDEGMTTYNIEMAPIDYAVPWVPTFNSPTHDLSQLSTHDAVTINWTAMTPTDGASVDSYTYVWDMIEDTDITATKSPVETLSGNLSGLTVTRTLSSGTWYLHLRATDSNGNWTSTQHIGPFIIDTQPKPAVTAISPTSGSNGSDTINVTVTGEYFKKLDDTSFSNVTAIIGNTPLSNISVVSSTSMTATYAIKDKTAGVYDVSVTTGWGTSSPLSGGFSIANPAPAVTGISPVVIRNASENEVIISGTGFLSPSSVPVESASPTVQLKQGATTVSLNNVTWISKTTLTATVPAGKAAGTYDVVVTNSDGQAGTLSGGFEIKLPAPTLSAVLPASVTNDASITITLSGTGFATSGGTPQVILEAAGKVSIACTDETVNNATTMTVVVPVDPDVTGVYSVRVSNPDGQAAIKTDAFSINHPIPAVTRITPSTMTNSGTRAVTIEGTSFRSGIKVFIGTTECTGVNPDSTTPTTRLTCTVPAGITAGAYDVVLNNEGVTTTGILFGGFSIANPAPAVTSISPVVISNATEEDVTITGTGFLSTLSVPVESASPAVQLKQGATTVSLNNVTWISKTTLTATVPAGKAAGTYDVVVTNSDGQAGTLSGGFEIKLPAPTLSAVLPASVTNDASITITLSGTGFATSGGTPQVILEADGKVSIACTDETVNNATTMTAVVPVDPDVTGVYSVKVTNPNGQTAIKIDAFSINHPIPAVTRITPSTMTSSGTQAVTIEGTGFRSGIKVFIGTTECTGVNPDSTTPTTRLTCTVPAGITAGAYDVVLNNEGVTTTGTLPGGFAVNEPIATAAIIYSVTDSSKVPAGELTITAIFTLPQSTVPKISIDQHGASDITDTNMAATSDDKVWTFTYTVSAADGLSYLDGEATVFISNTSGAITITTGSKFTIDTKDPTVPGDLNGDGAVDLKDAVIAVQAMVGIDVSGAVVANYATAGVDVDGDGKIGVAEAAFILQEISGMRQ